jgi:hypothetical protein
MGRKTCVVVRDASIGRRLFARADLVIEHDDDRGPEAEIRALRSRLEEVSSQLALAEARRAELEATLPAEADAEGDPDGDSDNDSDNVYVFAVDDESTDAFDRFFTSPDPHLDKVRRFLLD